MEPHCDYAEMLRLVEQQGKIIFGSFYKIHKVDEPVVRRMITYFFQDVEMARAEGIRLGKGLMLSGPTGCGKTALMQIFTAMSGGDFVPHIVSAGQVALDYADKGHVIIRKYGDQSFHPVTRHPIVYCFDNLGAERPMCHFGPPCNVLAEILISRGEMAASQLMLTHVTTRMDAVSLEKHYGKAVRSLMRSMFNLIHFSKESPDKRR